MINSGVIGWIYIKALIKLFPRWNLENQRDTEYPEMVKAVNQEMKRKEELANGSLCSFLQGFRT
jgi:hypothetical protein